MYFVVIPLTMFILPTISVVVEYAWHPSGLAILVGKWFVFWGVGMRLGMAGLRQLLQPEFTATEIFHVSDSKALPIVRELGIANFATAIVGATSLFVPSFVLPIAITAGIFYGAAGLIHFSRKARSPKETVAMVSDISMFLVLGAFVVARLLPSPS